MTDGVNNKSYEEIFGFLTAGFNKKIEIISREAHRDTLASFHLNLTTDEILESEINSGDFGFLGEIKSADEIARSIYALRNPNIYTTTPESRINSEAMIKNHYLGRDSMYYIISALIGPRQRPVMLKVNYLTVQHPMTLDIHAVLYARIAGNDKILNFMYPRIILHDYEYLEWINTVDRMIKAFTPSEKGVLSPCDEKPLNDENVQSDIRDSVIDSETELFTSSLSVARIIHAMDRGDRYTTIFHVKSGDGIRVKKIEYFRLGEDADSIFCTRTDVTESVRTEHERNELLRSALESALEAGRAKSAFTSRMSHEIRTPLNAVIGYIDIARSSEDNPETVHKCLEKCEIAAKQLLGIVNDVLDMSAINSGRLKLASDTFNLHDAVYSAADIFMLSAKQKSIKFTVDDTGLKTRYVVGDRLRLTQILINLISNAVKFTPSGGMITVTLTESISNADKTFVTFTVADTGIGMSEDFLNRIFTPYEQQSAYISEKYGGSGLGLSITKNLVSLMCGSVEVKSTPGHGSTFRVGLPFGTAAQPGWQELGLPPKDAFIGKRVLLAEDNEMNTEISCAILTSIGFTVEHARDGSEAVRLYTQHEPGYYDTVLMDVHMPVMGGYEATGLIRKSGRADAGTIPVIALTASAFTEDIADALAAGMNDHISKPISRETIAEVLAKHIKQM